MLTIAGRIILALVIAMIATPAWGECAWVFWSYVMKYDKPDAPATQAYWVVEDALPTYEACKKTLAASKKKLLSSPNAKELNIVGGPDGGVQIDFGGGRSMIASGYCRPDTLDPRK